MPKHSSVPRRAAPIADADDDDGMNDLTSIQVRGDFGGAIAEALDDADITAVDDAPHMLALHAQTMARSASAEFARSQTRVAYRPPPPLPRLASRPSPPSVPPMFAVDSLRPVVTPSVRPIETVRSPPRIRQERRTRDTRAITQKLPEGAALIATTNPARFGTVECLLLSGRERAANVVSIGAAFESTHAFAGASLALTE